MATPRSKLVDESVTPWYHCISRCVRRAFLCGEGFEHRKQWIQDRLRVLVDLFAVECAGFAIMDNHLHVLLRLDSGRSRRWSAKEVVERWFGLFPLRDISGNVIAPTDARVARFAADEEWVARMRARLANLGWFMKSLKEPLARIANQEDGCSGAFWEGRYRSKGVRDVASLLATAAYIDLNPVAAAVAVTPEESKHTSLRARLDHCAANGTIATLRDDLSTLSRNPDQEAGLWLLPIDDNRAHGGARAGLCDGLTLSSYLRLVDATSRMVRAGKASLEADMAPIFDRLRLDQSVLECTVTKLFQQEQRVAARRGTSGNAFKTAGYPAQAVPDLLPLPLTAGQPVFQ